MKSIMGPVKKSAIVFCAFVLSSCSQETESESDTFTPLNFNCAQVQTTYNLYGADGTNPDAIDYCASIGEFTP